jgi:hypothetical protein
MWPEYRISADAESSLLDSNPEGQTISILLVHSKVDSKTKYWGAVLKLKLTTIGTSVGVILPKEAFGGLKVDKDKGDSNFLTEERERRLQDYSIRPAI